MRRTSDALTTLERLVRENVAGEPAADILETPEKIAELRDRLRTETEGVFAEYDQIHLESWMEASSTLVD